MKTKFFGAIVLLLAFSFTATAQIRYHQLQTLPDGSILIGQGSANTATTLNAALIPVDAITNLTATDVQAALAEHQSDIDALVAGGSDGNNFTSAISFSGTTTKTLTLERDGLADLTATFTDQVNDPDADASNEINVLGRTANTNTITATNGGGSTSVKDDHHGGVVTISGGATSVTLPAVPDLNDTQAFFARNGVVYEASTTDGNAYWYINGTTLQPATGEAPLADGEVVKYSFPK